MGTIGFVIHLARTFSVRETPGMKQHRQNAMPQQVATHIKINTPLLQRCVLFTTSYKLLHYLRVTCFTTAVKACGSLTASSARTLRSSATPAALMSAIRRP